MTRVNDLRCTIVVFGASGDLTQRMVMPAIFRLMRRGLLPPEFRVIGYARTAMTDDDFRARMRKAVMRESQDGDKAAWTDFAARLSYVTAAFDGDDLAGYAELARRFDQFGSGAGDRRLFYLATPPACREQHSERSKKAILRYLWGDTRPYCLYWD